jgi:membrane protease YdiL (CAAX protease family)
MSRRSALLPFAVVAFLYVAFRVIERPDWALLSDATEGMLKLVLWVVPCLLAIRWTDRVGYRDVFAELGLDAGIARGYGFGLAATLPMLVVFAVPGPREGNLAGTIGSALLGPIAEEVLFRGYLFRQLYRRSGWPVRRAVLASALVFGLAHMGNIRIEGLQSWMFVAGEVGVTAAGGALFAWIVFRWESLWPAIGLHAFMNLWWDLSGAEDWAAQAQAGASAIGNQISNVARLASIGLAIYLTLRLARRGDR